MALALVALALAGAGVGLAAAFTTGDSQTPSTGSTTCMFGGSAVGPITVDEQGHVFGDTTPATSGCRG
jgi:hypothetical protein